MQFYLTGDDPPLVEETAHRVIAEMQDVNEIRGPRIRGDLPRPEIIVHPRFAVAAQLGVSVQAISQTIRIATLGDLPQNGAKFSLSDRQIPIRVSLLESARRDLTTLENLPVPTSSGGAVPLKTVADLSFGQGPSAVRRYNQTRRVFIEADLSPGVQFGTANKKVYALPTLTHLPQGVHLVPKGDSEYFGEMIKSFALAIGAGILMVLAVLVLLFVRVFQPSDHPVRAAAVSGRCRARAGHHGTAFLARRGHRLSDAHGHRRQELHPAGGLRDRGNAGRQVAHGGVAPGRPQACEADRDDLRGHGRRHAAGGHRLGW